MNLIQELIETCEGHAKVILANGGDMEELVSCGRRAQLRVVSFP